MGDDWIGEALAAGLSSDQLELHIQPVVELATGAVAGGEAFVRWHHPEHGVVPASSWIPRAEATGVLADACRTTAGEWIRASSGLDGPIVSFNVGVDQLEDDQFVQGLLAADAHAVHGLALEVHHTEFATMDPDLVGRLAQLGSHGIALWLDDFGDGPSDLGLLDRLPFDIVKLDRALLDAGIDELGTVAAAFHDRGLSTLIEGVENDDHRTASMEAGISFAQGFLYGWPIVATDFWSAAAGDLAPARVRRQLSGASPAS